MSHDGNRIWQYFLHGASFVDMQMNMLVHYGECTKVPESC